MKVMIFNSEHASNILGRIQKVEEMTGNKIELKIGDVIETLIHNAEEEDYPERAAILTQYGEEIIALKNDLMNKLTRLEELGWFKEIYLYSDDGMVVMTF